MDTQISRMQIQPEDNLIIKNDLIDFFFESVWKRVEPGNLKKGFQTRGLVVCSDGTKEMSITFNDFSGEGRPDENLTTQQMFHTLKYGPRKRYILTPDVLRQIEKKVREKLERFFEAKLMISGFNFNACGLVMLSDGSNEIHLRMKNIRKTVSNELIILNNDDDDVVTVELPSTAEEPLYISSGEEDLDEQTSNKKETTECPKLIFANREEESNKTEMNQNDYLKAYINLYNKQMNRSKADSNLEKTAKNSQHESFNVNSVLNLSLKSPENRGIKRESISKENYDRPKKPRLSYDGIPNDDTAYACKLCNETFTGRQNYFQHTKTVHGKVPCHICGNTFTQKGNMERHMNSHLGKKLFNCDECKASYTRLESLQSHKAKHHKL